MKKQALIVYLLTLLALVWRALTYATLGSSGEPIHPDQVLMTSILGGMGLLVLLTGFLSFLRLQNRLTFILFLYCFAMCIHWGYFPNSNSESLNLKINAIYIFISMFMGSCMLHLSRCFYSGTEPSQRQIALIYLPVLIGGLLFLLSILDSFSLELFQFIEFVLVTLYSLIAYTLLIRVALQSSTTERSARGLNVIMVGILLGTIPYLLSNVLPMMSFGGEIGNQPYSILFMSIPISMAIAISRASRSKALEHLAEPKEPG